MVQRLWVCAAFSAALAGLALGQVVPAPAAAPAATTQPDALENPVTFLLIRLASTEESLKAVDAALGKENSEATATRGRVSSAAMANQTMDRNGGGPVPWDQFYGRTAKGFYVSGFFTSHPVGRPTQFNYIYRANRAEAQKAQREVAALNGQIDELRARQGRLESDRSALWARIAAAMVGQRDIADQPIYQYHLVSVSMDKSLPGQPSERADSIEALGQFLRTMDSVMSNVDSTIASNQRQAIEDLKINAEHAQKDLAHSMALINQPEIQKQLRPLMTLCKNLATIAGSSAEAADLAADAERANDPIEKSTALGLLQTAWVDITEKIGALDDGITKIAGAWHIAPDTNKPMPNVTLLEARAMSDTFGNNTSSMPAVDGNGNHAEPIDLLASVHLPDDAERGHWEQVGSDLRSDSTSPSTLRLQYIPRGDYDFAVSFTRISGSNFVEMILNDRGSRFCWIMGALNNRVVGFAKVDNHTVDHNRSSRHMKIINGETYTAVLRVRQHGVVAFLNGDRITSISTDKVKLSPPPVTIAGNSLGIGAGEGGLVVFHSAEVTPVGNNSAMGKL